MEHIFSRSNYVNKMSFVDEFLLMIASLTLAELDHAAIISLHEMFEEFAEMHKGQPMLSKESLSKLMDRLQHHEDEIELNCIMNEWDVDHDHHLTFDAFVSIVSTHLNHFNCFNSL